MREVQHQELRRNYSALSIGTDVVFIFIIVVIVVIVDDFAFVVLFLVAIVVIVLTSHLHHAITPRF